MVREIILDEITSPFKTYTWNGQCYIQENYGKFSLLFFRFKVTKREFNNKVYFIKIIDKVTL